MMASASNDQGNPALRAFARRLDLAHPVEPFHDRRWRHPDQTTPMLHLEDVSVIPLLSEVARVEEYQHLARVRAHDGDLYATVTPTDSPTKRTAATPSMSTKRCSASAPVSSTVSRGRRLRSTALGRIRLTRFPRRRSSWSGGDRPWLIALVRPLVFGGCGDAETTLDWTSVEQLITKEFARVPVLTTTELEALLSDPSHEVGLLDAREADEYAVCHLHGAHIATSEDDAVVVLEQLDAAVKPEVVIVAYCSAGYLSAALVQRLHAKGFTNAVNLEGSIFAWAN